MIKYDLNLLKAFDAIYKERNVTRAAESMSISQPAMSAVLTRLRDLFNDPLFIRHKSGVAPTEKAIDIHSDIERALDILDGVVQSEQLFTPLTEKRTFTIAASEYFQIAILPALLIYLRQHAPHIRVVCITFTQDLADTGMMSGNTDLAFGRITDPADNLIVKQVITEGLSCLVSATHSSIKQRLTMQQFEKFPHVVIQPHGKLKTGVFQMLRAKKINRDIACVVTHFQLATDVLIDSDYIAVLPTRLCQRFTQNGQLKLLAPPEDLGTFPFHLAWHRRYQKDPAHQWLRNQIMACCDAI
ncbi:MAG: DNA-binding transcriptional LysR family regulator [Candidatus Endobugula sp.]|jgi:DNA-binding transcriptional LysR family regulator